MHHCRDFYGESMRDRVILRSSPLPLGGDTEERWSCPTFVIGFRHSRQSLSEVHLGFVPDGSPMLTGENDGAVDSFHVGSPGEEDWDEPFRRSGERCYTLSSYLCHISRYPSHLLESCQPTLTNFSTFSSPPDLRRFFTISTGYDPLSPFHSSVIFSLKNQNTLSWHKV